MSPRRAPSPPPRPRSEALLHKYGELLRKHEALVHKLEQRNAEHISTWKLSAWGLETTSSGLALMRGDTMLLSNKRWNELARLSGPWRRRSPGTSEGPEPHTLREVAQAEARAVLGSPGAGARVTRYQCQEATRTLELRSERAAADGGMAPRVLVLALDISDLVRAEEELARAREAMAEREHLRALGEMASGIAHDLNNTLNSMRLRLELIQRDPEFAERQRGHLDALVRIVSDANTRLRQLQDFARQRPERPGERVRLAEVVREAVEIARGDIEHRAAQEGLHLRLVADVSPLPAIQGSAVDLRYVLINLLLNARDAMPHGGTIRVRGWRENGRVVLAVEDEGTGIPPEHLPHLFRPFFTTKGSRGTGLGLAMAYGVVSRAGGTLTAANRPQGGAVFTLTFPVSPEPDAEPPSPRKRTRTGGKGLKRRR